MNMMTRLSLLLVLCALRSVSAQTGVAWTDNDHSVFMRTAASSSSRPLATKELESTGPVCAITSHGLKLLCWWTAGFAVDDRDRSFTLDVPQCLNASRFVSVRVHMDVWALTDSGHIVVFAKAGAMGTTPRGYPDWPVNSTALLDVRTGGTRVGVFLGPWLDFWVFHDIAANPSDGVTNTGRPGPIPARKGPQDWRREVCALGTDGEISCWLLMAGLSDYLHGLPGAVNASAACGGWVDLTGHMTAASSRPIVCPSHTSSMCSSSSQGPFEAMSWFPAPYDGFYRSPAFDTGASMRWRSGYGDWMGAFLYRNPDRQTFAAGWQVIPDRFSDLSTRQFLRSLEEYPLASSTGFVYPLTYGPMARPVIADTGTDTLAMVAYITSDNRISEVWQWRRGPNSFDNSAYSNGRRATNVGQLNNRWKSIATGYHGLMCFLLTPNGTVRCTSGADLGGDNVFTNTWSRDTVLKNNGWLQWWSTARDVNASLITGGWGGMCVLNGENMPYCATADNSGLPMADAFPAPPSFSVNVIAVAQGTAVDSFCLQMLSNSGGLLAKSRMATLSGGLLYSVVKCYGSQTFVQSLNPLGHPSVNTTASTVISGPTDICAARGGDAVCWGTLQTQDPTYRLLDPSYTTAVLPIIDNATVAVRYTAVAAAPTFQCGIVNVTYNCSTLVMPWDYDACVWATAATQRTFMAMCAGRSNTSALSPACAPWSDPACAANNTYPWTSMVPSNTTAVSAVVAGSGFACFVLTSGGALHCVGDYNPVTKLSQSADLKSQTRTSSYTGDATIGYAAFVSTGSWSKVTAGSNQVCGYHSALTDFICLSTNGGSGSYPGKSSAGFGSTAPASVVMGALHGCAIKASGAVLCFGSDTNGQVSGVSTWSADSFSYVMPMLNSTCGVTTTGLVRCWGALAKLHTDTYVIASTAELDGTSVARINAFSVGQAGASDVTCATTGVCATLDAAIAAVSALPATSRTATVTVYGTLTLAPLVIPPPAYGIRIVGASSASTLRFSTSVGPAPWSQPMVLMDVQAGTVAVIGLTITTDTAGMCADGIRYIRGRVLLQAVRFQDMDCSGALLRFAGLWSGDWPARAPQNTARPSLTTSDARLEGLSFSNATAPTYIRVDRGFLRVSLWNVSAVARLYPNATGGMAYARFLGLFHGPTTAGVLQLMDVSVSGFRMPDWEGGAVVWSGGNGFVDFIRVAASDIAAGYGALLASNSAGYQITLQNVTVNGATATAGRGGAVYFYAATAGALASVKVDFSSFQGCTAASDGGALYFHSGANAFTATDMVTMTNDGFQDCRGDGMGGSVYVGGLGGTNDWTTITLRGVSFSNTTARLDGGALAVDPRSGLRNLATIDISDTTITDAVSGGRGGAVFVNQTLRVQLTRIGMTGVEAAAGGGAVWAMVRPSCVFPLDCTNLLYPNNGIVSVVSSNFSTCKCSGPSCQGGCWYADAMRINIQGVNVTSATATDYGGCGYNTAIFYTFDRLNIGRCVTKRDGGALYLQAGVDTSITNSIITDSAAGTGAGTVTAASPRGGAIAMYMDALKAGFYGFSYPTTATPTITITALAVTNATADSDGGCVSIINSGPVATGTVVVRVTSSSLDSCTSRRSGGGLMLDQGGTSNFGYDVTIANTAVTRSSAVEGGAFAIVGSATARRVTGVSLSGCNLAGNRASADGGAIGIRFIALTVDSSVLTANTAQLSGGAIMSRGSSVDIRSVALSSNMAAKGVGGAVATLACTGTGLTSSRIPTVTKLRGSHYSQWLPIVGTEHLGVGTILLNNSAYADGGAVYIQGCNTDLAFLNFVDNTAGSGGGALAAAFPSDEAAIRLRYSVFAGNTATSSTAGGGAIMLRSASGSQPLCSPAEGYSAAVDPKAADTWRAMAIALALNITTKTANKATLLPWLPLQQIRPIDNVNTFGWTETKTAPIHSCACSAVVSPLNVSWTVTAITPAGPALAAAPVPSLLVCNTTSPCCIISAKLSAAVTTPTAYLLVKLTQVGNASNTRQCTCNTISGTVGITDAPAATALDRATHLPYPRISLLSNVTTCGSGFEDVTASLPANNTPVIMPNGTCTGNLTVPYPGISTTGCSCMANLCTLLAAYRNFSSWVYDPVGDPWLVERQASCYFTGNSATYGRGGDVLATPAAGFRASVSLQDSWLWQGRAAIGGGSVALDSVAVVTLSGMAINGSSSDVPATGAATSAAFTYGNGGGLSVYQAEELYVTNVTITGARAVRGGGLFLQRKVAGDPDDKHVYDYPDADTIVLSNVTLASNNAAGGGAMFVDVGTVPLCSGCNVTANSASLWGRVAATSARRAVISAAPYLGAFNLSDGTSVTASAVIGGIAVEQPLIEIQLWDLMNSTVIADNQTICEVTANKNGSTAILPLSYDSRYTAVNGVVRIYPFAVSIGPGAYGRLTVQCSTGEGRLMPPITMALVTELVRTVWLPANFLVPQLVLPSTLSRPRYVDTPLAVAMVDAAGLPLSSVSVSCGITVDRAVRGDGTATTASIMGTTSSYTTNGIAYFRPAVQADSNITVHLTATCTWITGDLVPADGTLGLKTYPLAVLLGVPGMNSTEAFGNASVAFNSSAVLSTPLMPGGPWPLPTALPSSSDVNTLQAFSPAPWAVVAAYHPVYGPMVVRDMPISCTVSAATDWAQANGDEILAAGSAQGDNVTAWSVLEDPVLQGTLTQTTVDGMTTFSRIGVRGAPFNAYTPLQISCSWATGEMLRSPYLVASTSGLRAVYSTPPVSWMLPSGPSTSSVIPFSPAPTVQLYKAPGSSNGTSGDDPSQLLTGFNLQCVLRLIVVNAPVTENNLRAALIGTTDSVMSALSGFASFTRVGVTGPFGSTVRLAAACTWLSGVEVTVISDVITLARMRLSIASEPPALLLPSNPSSVSPMKPPVLRVEVDDPTAAAVVVIGQAGNGTNSSGTGGGQTTWSALPGYQLSIAVSLVIPTQDAGISGSNLLLQGDTVSTTDAGGTATFQRIAVSGPFGGKFNLSFASTWLSGQSLSIATDTKRFPVVWLSWGLASMSVLPASAVALLGTLAAKATRPPPYVLYNTPIAAVGVTLSYSGSGAPALPSGGVGIDVGGGNPIGSLDWDSTGAADGDLRCSLDAVSGTPPLPVVVTGSSTVTPLTNGTFVFTNIALLPPVGSEGSSVSIRASCTLRGLVLPLIQADTMLQRLRVVWDVAPPASALPSSQTESTPFDPPVRIKLANHTGGVLAEESGTTCTLVVSGTDFSPSVQESQAKALLLGTTRAVILNGYTSFPGLAVSAPFGSAVNITASCTRPQGGLIASVESTVMIDAIEVAWNQRPANGTTTNPGYLLYGSWVPMSVIVTRFQADPANGWQPKPGTRRPEAGIHCAVKVGAAPEDMYNPTPLIRLSSIETEGTAVTGADGQASFKLVVTGVHDTRGLVTVACSRADQDVLSDSTIVKLEQVHLSFARPPPGVWLPSSGLAKTPIKPEPTILLKRASGASAGRVDARGAVCRVGVEPSSIAAIQEPPLEGYKLSLLEVLPDGTVLEASADGSDATADDPNITALAQITPIRLPDILIRSPFAVEVNLTVVCARSQGDTTAVLRWPMRMTDNALRYADMPPDSTVSQRAFQMSVELFDSELEAELRDALVLAGVQTPVVPRNATVISLDDVTACVLSVTTPDPAIVIQNNDAKASFGLVPFRGVSLTARVGSTVTGIIQCSLGQLAYTDGLDFRITMEPCEAGTAPSGVNGYECGVCGTGTYSDGGLEAACVQCPRGGGVQCTGGHLRLIPGYYRADKQSTINEKSEFHLCYNDEACVVDTDTSNRSAIKTHACKFGYTGPLCGVCDETLDYASLGTYCRPCWSKPLSAFVLALLPVAIFLFVFYISAIRRQTKGNPSEALLRIFLTWVSTLGTLGSLYIARGTQTFREVFGFSDIIGSSPLTIPPVQCQLRLGFYTRYGITALLPVLMALASILVAVCIILHLETKRCRRKLTVVIKPHVPSWLMSRCTWRSSQQSGDTTVANSRAHASSSFMRAAMRAEASARNPLHPSAVAASQRVLSPTNGGAGASSRRLTPTGGGGPAELTDKQSGRQGDSTRNLTFWQQLTLPIRQCFHRIDLRVMAYFRTQSYLAPVIFILNISYSAITTSSFSVFNCLPYSIGSGPTGTDKVVYLSTDLSVACYTLQHTAWRAVAGLIIAGAVAGLPIYFYSLLRRNKDKLQSPVFYSRFGFLYEGYSIERGMQGWESIVMFRKATVVLIGSLIKDSVYQIAAAIVLLVGCLFLHATYQPFSSTRLNAMESASLITVILTQLISLFYLRFDLIAAPCNGEEGGTVVDTAGTTCEMITSKKFANDLATTVLLVLLNLGFAFIMLRMLFIECFRDIKDTPTGITMRNWTRKMRGQPLLTHGHIKSKLAKKRKDIGAGQGMSSTTLGGAPQLDPLRADGMVLSDDEDEGEHGQAVPEAGTAGKRASWRVSQLMHAQLQRTLSPPSIGTLKNPRSKVTAFYPATAAGGNSAGLSPDAAASGASNAAVAAQLSRRTFDPLGLDLSGQLAAARQEQARQEQLKAAKLKAVQSLMNPNGGDGMEATAGNTVPSGGTPSDRQLESGTAGAKVVSFADRAAVSASARTIQTDIGIGMNRPRRTMFNLLQSMSDVTSPVLSSLLPGRGGPGGGQMRSGPGGMSDGSPTAITFASNPMAAISSDAVHAAHRPTHKLTRMTSAWLDDDDGGAGRDGGAGTKGLGPVLSRGATGSHQRALAFLTRNDSGRALMGPQSVGRPASSRTLSPSAAAAAASAVAAGVTSYATLSPKMSWNASARAQSSRALGNKPTGTGPGAAAVSPNTYESDAWSDDSGPGDGPGARRGVPVGSGAAQTGTKDGRPVLVTGAAAPLTRATAVPTAGQKPTVAAVQAKATTRPGKPAAPDNDAWDDDNDSNEAAGAAVGDVEHDPDSQPEASPPMDSTSDDGWQDWAADEIESGDSGPGDDKGSDARSRSPSDFVQDAVPDE